MFGFLDDFKPYGHWLLRRALGSVFVIHGIGNFMNLGGFAATLGVPHAMGLLLVVAEIAGGILVLSGSYMGDKMTRLGALMLMPVLLVAMYTMHWKDMSFTLSRVHVVGGVEYLLVLFLISLYMLLKGNKT
jgi:putative oxidoreductase